MRVLMEISITINTDEPSDNKEVIRLLKGNLGFIALHSIMQQVFRPARKHGYPDKKLQTLLDKIGDDGYDLISELEDLAQSIIDDYEINDQIND